MNNLAEPRIMCLVFESSNNEVSVSLETPHINDVEQVEDNDHTITRWARLGMRYFTQMKNKGMFHDLVPHVTPVKMRIALFNAEALADDLNGLSFDEEVNVCTYSEDEDKDEDEDDYNILFDEVMEDFYALSEESREMTVGINLYAETTDRIGGFSTPSAVAGISIYKLLKENLLQVKA